MYSNAKREELVVDGIQNLKVPGKDEDKTDFYRALWKNLEQAANTPNYRNLDIAIYSTLNKLTQIQCDCVMSAPQMFAVAMQRSSASMFDTTLTTDFLTQRGRRAYIHYVHNMVNLKTDKPLVKQLEND